MGRERGTGKLDIRKAARRFGTSVKNKRSIHENVSRQCFGLGVEGSSCA